MSFVTICGPKITTHGAVEAWAFCAFVTAWDFSTFTSRLAVVVGVAVCLCYCRAFVLGWPAASAQHEDPKHARGICDCVEAADVSHTCGPEARARSVKVVEICL